MNFIIVKKENEERPTQPSHGDSSAYSSGSLGTTLLPIVSGVVGSLKNPPLEAADTLVFSHETIKSICASHSYLSTMHPKPFRKLSLVGSHVHLSISRLEVEQSFLAGDIKTLGWNGILLLAEL